MSHPLLVKEACLRDLRAVLLCVILSTFASLQSPALVVDGPADKTGAVILADGTPIELRITQTLTTAHAKVGDPVEFEVVHDVKVGDLIVIPRHSAASGVVDAITPRRRLSRSAELVIIVKTAKSINGSDVPIKGARMVVGNTNFENAAQDSGMLIFVVPFVIKGDEAFVSKGAKFTAYVSGNASFDPAEVRQNMATLDQKTSAVLAAATGGKAEVHFYRHAPDIVGGKPTIYLDGDELAHLQGDRHFSILVNPGTHAFRTSRSEIRLECKAGEEYYLRLERRGSFSPQPYLTLMSGEQGEDEMYPLRLSDSKDIQASNKLVKSEIAP